VSYLILSYLFFVVHSCVAQVSGEAFVPYYSSFMPGIMGLLRMAASPELNELRGKAMECAGLVGEAVGVQVFGSDALEIMNLFMHALVS
jgi:importin-5